MRPDFILCLGVIFALSGCVSREQSDSHSIVTRDTRGEKVQIGTTRGTYGPLGPLGRFDVVSTSGPAGKEGERGERGDRGPAGQKGAPGEPGRKGDRGEPGVRGIDGERGLNGETGKVGERGEKGDMGVPGADASYSLVGVSSPLIVPWFISQAGSDSKKLGEENKANTVESVGLFFYYLLVGFSALITALSPLILVYFESRKESDDGASKIPDILVKGFYTILQLFVLVFGSLFVAFLALHFMQWLLIFICVYSLVIAIAFVCYAYGKTLLASHDNKLMLADLKLERRRQRQFFKLQKARNQENRPSDSNTEK